MQSLTQMTTYENIQYVHNLKREIEIFGFERLSINEKIEIVFIVEQVKKTIKETES
jgi:hypothetical protein